MIAALLLYKVKGEELSKGSGLAWHLPSGKVSPSHCPFVQGEKDEETENSQPPTNNLLDSTMTAQATPSSYARCKMDVGSKMQDTLS